MSEPGAVIEPAAADHPAAAPLRWSWTLLLVALAAWGLTNMDQSFFGYAAAGIMQTFGLSLNSIGLLISGSFILSILVAIPAGTLTDIYGPRWTCAGCLGISALLVGLQGCVHSAAAFAILRMVASGFSGALSPITLAMVSTATPVRSRPLALAILQCGYPLGWFAASLIVQPVLPAHGWRGLFFAGFFVVPVAALFLVLIPRKARVLPTAKAPRPSLAAPMRELMTPRFRRLTLQGFAAFFLYGGATGGTVYYLPTFFQAAKGYSATQAAGIVGLSYAVGCIGYVGSALVSQTLLSRRTTVGLWLALGFVMFTTVLWTRGGVAMDSVLFALTVVFFYGSSSIAIIYLLELFPDRLAGAASAAAGTSGIALGFVVFPVLTAAASGWLGWSGGFSLVVLPAILIAALLMITLPKASPDVSPA